jgi:hypothetical protein
MALAEGTQLGPYHIVSLLGVGGMGKSAALTIRASGAT